MKEGFLEATRGLPGSLDLLEETLKDVEMKGTQLLMNVAYHLVDYDAGETVEVTTLRLCLKTILFLLWKLSARNLQNCFGIQLRQQLAQ